MAKRSDGISKVDDIDEKEFLSILDGRATPSALPKRENTDLPAQEIEMTEEAVRKYGDQEEKEVVPKRTHKRKKNGEYLDAFLKPRVLKQRQSVYISQDVHEFISKIVNKLGDRNMTVGVFIDTVMMQHIREHMDELKAIYYREEGDIFKNIVNNNEDD
ncbi:DUF3408 domain-containing protein [Dysgonomonas sp. Marseille-P4677]|uniref:DUF3408 domain-containing protein n=1 Tax=Dysgonomonas sp. Marseille-P4677 TaxID=2364790 RepID=UPI001913CDEE|nr:DUF3408 domain-containing protein [Dysgonomonas sp. Marseille-P4677]MBK5719555.1 DUF3408 domain-containing protein [Dysgonomonas sp. Marseille-P4677]